MAYQTVNASLFVQFYVKSARKAPDIKHFRDSAHVNLNGQSVWQVISEGLS